MFIGKICSIFPGDLKNPNFIAGRGQYPFDPLDNLSLKLGVELMLNVRGLTLRVLLRTEAWCLLFLKLSSQELWHYMRFNGKYIVLAAAYAAKAK